MTAIRPNLKFKLARYLKTFLPQKAPLPRRVVAVTLGIVGGEGSPISNVKKAAFEAAFFDPAFL
jgi:hypothetical protein